MNALKVFEYQGAQTRTHTDQRGITWWVAKDVCEILRLRNVSDALNRLDEDERCVIDSTDTAGRPGSLLAVNESGLYSLVIGSKKSEAKKFKKWITSEVLPSIRKTGSYTTNALAPADPLDQLKLTVKILEEQRAGLSLVNQRVNTLEVVQADNTLSSAQQFALNSAIYAKYVEFNRYPKVDGWIRRSLKDTFIAGHRTKARSMDIAQRDFEDALAHVSSWQPNDLQQRSINSWV